MPLLDALKFNQSNLRDILNTIGEAADVNVTFERDFQERTYSVQLEKGTLADALQQILSSTGNFFKVINQRTILIIPDQRAEARSSTTISCCRRSISRTRIPPRWRRI